MSSTKIASTKTDSWAILLLGRPALVKRTFLLSHRRKITAYKTVFVVFPVRWIHFFSTRLPIKLRQARTRMIDSLSRVEPVDFLRRARNFAGVVFAKSRRPGSSNRWYFARAVSLCWHFRAPDSEGIESLLELASCCRPC